MDMRWFLTFGVVLICLIYVAIGTEQQQSRFGLWLDRHSSEEIAEANALRPLIKCINVADVPWRLDRATSATALKAGNAPDDFPYLQRYDADAIRRDFCKPGIVFKVGMLPGTRQLEPVVNRYTSAFNDVLMRHEALQRYSPASALLAMKFHDTYYNGKIEAFLAASDTLRPQLESLDLALRPRQLEQLEQRLGRDQHWYLLNYMIQARETVKRLDEAATRRQLDLPLLGAASEALRQARQAGETYRDSLPANHRRGPVHDLWALLEQPAQRYQAALEQLATDWRNRAEPQVLSDDFWNVTHRYDVLLALYNKQADVDF
ncbi:DUF3829 domain-containing protein [Pseudomonas gingeri]|uniref:DUF3829 domain-containing protein n=1 Tax=Pseudomonas gingeri TaxID=117681 RepID=UPI0015A4BDB6|nr:DUF3829 domain-containing protein [Pseudomonas gingeri]NWA02410.1 DUF3829 domain-containing protein [Pseudomonas gingeri]NWA12417.1 DUF3829 domain-containing protein [Pseudomonas gingeri]NWA57177.1 DUF3829 domain-containing protein [Pseudomonas gingeri]NWA93520.1 DUF3829 domain-containing protein [Pseudomonas gingeri]NWB02992.1 DUF3829 domain-containing protein [Pseudomonas gingeri]